MTTKNETTPAVDQQAIPLSGPVIGKMKISDAMERGIPLSESTACLYVERNRYTETCLACDVGRIYLGLGGVPGSYTNQRFSRALACGLVDEVDQDTYLDHFYEERDTVANPSLVLRDHLEVSLGAEWARYNLPAPTVSPDSDKLEDMTGDYNLWDWIEMRNANGFSTESTIELLRSVGL